MVNDVVTELEVVNNVVEDASSTRAESESESEFSTDATGDFSGMKKKREPVPDFLEYEMKLQHMAEPYEVSCFGNIIFEKVFFPKFIFTIGMGWSLQNYFNTTWLSSSHQ